MKILQLVTVHALSEMKNIRLSRKSKRKIRKAANTSVKEALNTTENRKIQKKTAHRPHCQNHHCGDYCGTDDSGDILRILLCGVFCSPGQVL